MITRSLLMQGTMLFETEDGEVWQVRHVVAGMIPVEIRKLGNHNMRNSDQVPMPLKNFYQEWQ